MGYWPRKNDIYNTMKCAKSEGVWILSKATVYKRGVQLPLKTWWLFLSSVWRPPHSFLRSCKVSCSSSPATSLTERLPEDEGKKRMKDKSEEQSDKGREVVYRCHTHQYINVLLHRSAEILFMRHYRGGKKASETADWLESISSVVFERGRTMTAAWHRLSENAPGVKGW